MPITINMENCQFFDNASVVRYNNEIGETEEKLNQQRDEATKELILALEELKSAIRQNNKTSIRKVISDFAVQFSSNLFANVAGAGLLALVKTFLP